jgi:hypothetical protein
MSTLNDLQNSPFPKLDRVIRNQRWLTMANGFVALVAVAAIGCGGDHDGIAPTPDSGLPVDSGGTFDAPPGVTFDAPPGVTFDAPPMMRCSTQNQTGCTDPALPKCSVALNAFLVWSNICRPQDPAMITEGTDCARATDSPPEAGVGNDNCAAGNYCTSLGNLDGTLGPGFLKCHKFCETAASCSGTQTCMALNDLSPPDGICIDPCTLFDGTECTAGAAGCFPAKNVTGATIGMCAAVGTVATGGRCGAGIGDCVANNVCINTDWENSINNCRPLCDAAHPCVDATMECSTLFEDFVLDVGVCVVPTPWAY